MYCGNCGKPAAGTAFCTSCGAPAASSRGQGPVDSTTQQSQVQASVPRGVTVDESAPPTASGAPQTTPSANPFAGIAARDIGIDALAAVLLLSSLALTWDLHHEATERWWVVLAIVVSVLGLTLPYLFRVGVVTGLSVEQRGLARVGAQAPYLLAVGAALGNELMNVAEDYEGGIGAAVAVGLAGVVLALQPHTDEETRADDAWWWRGSVLLGAAGLALVVITSAIFVITTIVEFHAWGLWDLVLLLAGVVTTIVLLTLVLLGLPLLGLWRRNRDWRRVYVVVGAGIAVAFLAGVMDAPAAAGPFVEAVSVEKLRSPGFGYFLLPASIAAALARPVRRQMREVDEAESWIRTAANSLLLIALTVAVVAAAVVLAMLQWGEASGGAVARLIIAALVAVAALMGRATLQGDRPNRQAALGTSGVLLVLATTYLIVANNDDSEAFSPNALAMWLALPVLTVFSLTAPRAVRERFGPLTPGAADQSAER
jgi:hypothetical protein